MMMKLYVSHALLLIVAGCCILDGTFATNYPVGITNCGVRDWIEKSPTRAVTLNQGTTEVMLALGLADKMVGTAYLDDDIWPEFKDDFDKIPELSLYYPDIDDLMDTNPDFLYGSYMSAFEARMENKTSRIDYLKHLDSCSLTVSNKTYCRSDLNDIGIHTYLQITSCEEIEYKPDEMELYHLYGEIRDIAMIFDVQSKAQALVNTIEGHFQNAIKISESNVAESKTRILWLDSINDDNEVYIGACCGSVQKIIDHSGLENIFEDKGVEEKRNWAHVNWTDVIEEDPDVIIIIDASWDSADEKIFHLCNQSSTRELTAVKNRRLLAVPFSASTMGVRIGALAYNLAEAAVALANGQPLYSATFSTDISLVEGTVIGTSGVKAYTQLPKYTYLDETTNENVTVDLEKLCEGNPTSTVVSDDPPIWAQEELEPDDSLPSWGVVLISLMGGLAGVSILYIFFLINRESIGQPVYGPP